MFIDRSNPIVARIWIGLSDILDLTNIPREDKKTIKGYLFEVSKNLICAQAYASKVLLEHEEIEKRSSQLNGKEFLEKYHALPSLQSLDEVNQFLYYSKKMLRHVATIIGLIFGKHRDEGGNNEFDSLYQELSDFLSEKNLDEETLDKLLESFQRIVQNKSANSFKKIYRNGRFDDIIKDLKKMFPDPVLIALLELHYPRIKKLTDLRNFDEHPKNPDDFLMDYRFSPQGDLRMELPSFNDGEGTHVYEFLKECLKWDFIFCEEVLLFSIIEYLPEVLEIKKIEEAKRDPRCPKRFKVILSGME